MTSPIYHLSLTVDERHELLGLTANEPGLFKKIYEAMPIPTPVSFDQSSSRKLASLTYSPTTMIYTVWQRGTTIVIKDFFKSLGEAADWCVANGWELQCPAPIGITPNSSNHPLS